MNNFNDYHKQHFTCSLLTILFSIIMYFVFNDFKFTISESTLFIFILEFSLKLVFKFSNVTYVKQQLFVARQIN